MEYFICIIIVRFQFNHNIRNGTVLWGRFNYNSTITVIQLNPNRLSNMNILSIAFYRSMSIELKTIVELTRTVSRKRNTHSCVPHETLIPFLNLLCVNVRFFITFVSISQWYLFWKKNAWVSFTKPYVYTYIYKQWRTRRDQSCAVVPATSISIIITVFLWCFKTNSYRRL